MNRSDNIKFLRELSYSRRRMAWRAGGVVAAIALSSCIGTGVAFADDTVVDASDQQTQTALVQDAQGAAESQSEASLSEEATATTEDVQEDTAAVEGSDQAPETTGDQSELESSDGSDTVVLVTPTSASSTASDDGTLAEDSAVKGANGETIESFDLRQAIADTDGTLTSNWTYAEGDTQSTITGGNSYVTPVKLQNPWGSCWAFSSTAASETSLLTELDKADDGKLNGTITYAIAAAWAKADWADDGQLNASINYGSAGADLGLLAEYASDLSERYLTWMSYYDVAADSIYPDQAGEGKYFVTGTKDAAAVYNSGGMPWLSLSEYSSGLGPVPEYVAPYIDDEGLYQVATPEINAAGDDLVYKYSSSYDELLAYSKATWNEDTLAEFNKKYGTNLTMNSVAVRKAKIGTWSVDESDPYCVVAELSNSNVLDQDLAVQGLTVQEILLMKQELLEGHAISIGFKADQSKPGQVLGGNTYLNTTTWAQYTYENAQINHAVTIVGYDDNYSASNFTHNIYMTDDDGNVIYKDGEPVVDEEATALTTPAGNGAWIVKNSWGCLDPEDPADTMNWGVNGSGYFYLSYYDKTISVMESYEYDVSKEAQARSSYVAYQHDLANVSAYTQQSTNEVSKMCNVFDGPEQGEGSISIRDLGFVTGFAGDTTTIEVYVMDDAADVVSTILKSSPVVAITQTFTNSGFHRIHLDSAIKVLPNQKFAIVQTTKESDGTYEYVTMNFYNEAFANAYNAVMAPLNQTGLPYYLKTVVNEGESLFLLNGGSWEDWTTACIPLDEIEAGKMTAQIQAQASKFEALAATISDPELKAKYLQVAENCRNFTINTLQAYDNWCLKAYADATGIEISKALTAVTERSFVYDGDVHSPHVLVTLGGKVLTEGIDYVLAGDIEEIEVGVYKIIINGIGEYMGSTSVTWKIISAEVPDDIVVPETQPNPEIVAPAKYEPVALTEAESPKTGDDATAAVGLAAALAALSSAVMLRFRRRKEQ